MEDFPWPPEGWISAKFPSAQHESDPCHLGAMVVPFPTRSQLWGWPLSGVPYFSLRSGTAPNVYYFCILESSSYQTIPVATIPCYHD